jgi:hypothetical protein
MIDPSIWSRTSPALRSCSAIVESRSLAALASASSGVIVTFGSAVDALRYCGRKVVMRRMAGQ